MAQISGTVRPLKRATRIAAITSSISVSKLVPAAWLRIASEQAGRADHHHLPMTDRAALAILLLQ